MKALTPEEIQAAFDQLNRHQRRSRPGIFADMWEKEQAATTRYGLNRKVWEKRKRKSKIAKATQKREQSKKQAKRNKNQKRRARKK